MESGTSVTRPSVSVTVVWKFVNQAFDGYADSIDPPMNNELAARRRRDPRGTVAIVLPAKNEGPSIGDIIDACLPHCDELVVVDGHSEDETVAIALDKGARVVKDNGLGKGDALRVGAEAVSSDVVVFVDADGSHDTNDIPHLVEPILADVSDMVVGSRGRGGSDELHGTTEKLLRMAGSDIILIAINRRWNVNLTDSQNGFRAIRTGVFRSLDTRENVTTIEQEMTMRCLRLGYRISEIPSHEYERRHGESTIRLRRVWFRYLYSLVRGLLG